MKLSRWLRRPPTALSWIEPAALAARLDQGDALLILDVRGPDEFTGPLGHIRAATNMPLAELPAHLPALVHQDRPVVVSAKPTADHRWQRSSYGRPAYQMFQSYAAEWNSGECWAYRQTEKSLKEAARGRALLARRGKHLGRRSG